MRSRTPAPQVEQLKLEALAGARSRGDGALDASAPRGRGERFLDAGCTLLVVLAAVACLGIFACGLVTVMGWVFG